MIHTRKSCDSCGSEIDDVFSMGEMPLANGLISASELNQIDERFPLVAAQCRHCTLTQLRYIVAPEILYRDYKFFSGASSPTIEHFEQLANWLKSYIGAHRVLEIGSNDGTLLQAMESIGLDVTGIDPASDQCDHARKKLTRGIVLDQFWASDTAEDNHGSFDTVVACNVLGHSPDLKDFLTGVRKVLRPQGRLVIEVQYLRSLISEAAFEMIYHEHVSYFDETSLSHLLVNNGFQVRGWEIINVQAGTLRMWATPHHNGGVVPSSHVDWQAFRASVRARKVAFERAVDSFQDQGRRVCFYGSPAKATQLANYWKLGADVVQFATDTTLAKQGYWIPGARIPIVHPSQLQPPDAAIVAAWNFYPQIVAKESAFLAAGGELLNPTMKAVLS